MRLSSGKAEKINLRTMHGSLMEFTERRNAWPLRFLVGPLRVVTRQGVVPNLGDIMVGWGLFYSFAQQPRLIHFRYP